MKKILLKRDIFGEVWQLADGSDALVRRDTGNARAWLRWLARRLMRREARALSALRGLDGVPQLIDCDSDTLTRTRIAGVPMYEGRPRDGRYFNEAARLLRRLHSAGVVHNDLAKEPNILVRTNGSPAFIDFQLAWISANRGSLFRLAAREDIRHLLKHKRTYRPDLLTAREKKILETPSAVSRLSMKIFKPAYLFVTRRLFGWADREGARDR